MKPNSDSVLELDRAARRGELSVPPCPVDRIPHRRRNQICIALMLVGGLNMLVYPVLYAVVGGDAHNGYRRLVTQPDGSAKAVYVVRGHFIRSVEGEEAQVNRALWIYSYLHSISLWLTSGAMIISMLVLARPHIIATMRDSWVSGQTFIAVLGTAVVLLTCGAAFVFTWDFVFELSRG